MKLKRPHDQKCIQVTTKELRRKGTVFLFPQLKNIRKRHFREEKDKKYKGIQRHGVGEKRRKEDRETIAPKHIGGVM